MKILTTVKRVADPDMKIKIAPDGSELETEGAEYVMNQMDEWGVEEAIQPQRRARRRSRRVSVGPSAATKEIRTALAMGADRGVLVETDETLDSDAVARIVAEVAKEEEPDLVTLGKLSLDTDRNQTGQLAGCVSGLAAGDVRLHRRNRRRCCSRRSRDRRRYEYQALSATVRDHRD